MPTIGSLADGTRLTVNMFTKNPLFAQKLMLSMLDQQFIVDEILRPAGSAPSGAVVYHESTSLFAENDPDVVAEFAEIPATLGSEGTPKVARAVRRALSLKISQEMLDEDNIDRVNKQMQQIRNSTIRAWEDTFLSLFRTNSAVPTMAATTGAWATATNVRKDLAEAKFLVRNADADTSNGTGQNKFGFDPDTIIISNRIAADLEQNDDMWKLVLSSPLASENPAYNGSLPRTLAGLRIVRSWRMPDTEAIILQSKVVGGIADSRPLRVTPMYEDKPRETWRSDVSRKSAMFLDEPKAALRITGLTT
ncbi:hypothetical protein ACIBSV_46765 [Embleya sp. NPDC050154]|uniref:phage major capsid protein n=1 Tax=Embleya sp. NPDC050154 TaxID=3363988 RepID=UPI0037BD2C47